MCGVFGIVFSSDNKDMGQILINASRRLTYRGYDSAGFATFKKDGTATLLKGPGKLEDVVSKFNIISMEGSRGIIQLRWATFGEPNEANSQPHYDCDKNIIGAHNGNIVNTNQLIDQFKKEGHTIRGTNDGEMVIHAYEKYFDLSNSMFNAIIEARKILKGDYAYIVGDISTNKLAAIKMGSSLYMGVGTNFICCSSDLTSILENTDQIIQINDGEFVIYDDKSYQFYDIYTGKEIHKVPVKSEISIESANLEGFPHFMLKEIYEQPTKTKELLELLDNNNDKIEELLTILEKSSNIYLVGSGTSYHACLIGSYYLNNLTKFSVTPVIAGAFNDYYLNSIKENDTIICVSQSGETKDLVNVINALKKLDKGNIIGIVNIVGSSIAIKSKISFNIAAGLEVSVPATKTFINQILLLLYISLYIGTKKQNKSTVISLDDLHKIPALLKETLDKVNTVCKDLIDEIKSTFEDSYCLGYGVNYGTALEGALKIKEVYYKHCEGMYSSEFKHGPLSIVEKNYPIFFVACKEDSLMVISHINEITCRGGNVITISPYLEDYERYSTKLITVPDTNKYFTPFLNTIVTQLIAYFSSIKDGINPDFPRNISKTLTVD